MCAAARAVAAAKAFDNSMSAWDIPHLHEQDATFPVKTTSAVWLGKEPSIRAGEASERLGLVRHGAGIFDEFLQTGHHRGTGEELTKNFDLVTKFFVGNGL